MKRLVIGSRSATALALGFLWILLPGETLGQHRFSFAPSMEIVETHDNNLFVSVDDPVADFILRVSPTLALRLDSPRWLVAATYGIDATRYATHHHLDNSRARQQSTVDLNYRVGPRLTLALEGDSIDTDNAAELNRETGLAVSRLRAQRISYRPSARFRISPRLSAQASFFSTRETLHQGPRMRMQFQTASLERWATPRDRFTIEYEQGNYVFEHRTAKTTTETHLLLAGWTHDWGVGSRLRVQAGPRITEDSPAAEIFASLTHQWRLSSLTLSCRQTQATLVGIPGIVETRSLEARFSYTPTPSLTAYAAPAAFRNTRQDLGLEATVYRIGLGVHYEVTPLIGLHATYGFDSQQGALEPLRADDRFSHGILSVGLTARLNRMGNADGQTR